MRRKKQIQADQPVDLPIFPDSDQFISLPVMG